jgi:hypothetical protein
MDAGDEAFRAEWALSFLASGGSDDVPAELDATYEFHIGDSVACLRISKGRMAVTPGACAVPADVTIRTQAPTIVAIVGQRLSVTDAVARKDLDVTGDPVAAAAIVGIINRRLPSRADA